MRFSMTADQRDHFVKHGYIAFEGLVPEGFSVEQIVRRRALAEVAADLVNVHPLKLGWYRDAQPLPTEVLLEQLGSVQGIAIGVAIKRNGEAIFFEPNHSFSLAEGPKEEYLLIAYAQRNAVYVLNESDPETHALKRLGYGFGDRLREETHPTLAR